MKSFGIAVTNDIDDSALVRLHYFINITFTNFSMNITKAKQNDYKRFFHTKITDPPITRKFYFCTHRRRTSMQNLENSQKRNKFFSQNRALKAKI